MSARYAIYYAPPAEHPLTAMASAWLGYDAWSAATVARPQIEGLDLDPASLEALVESPRRYGFHATLKAPFELAAGQSEAALFAALTEFASTQPSFTATLAVQSLSGFIALTLAEPCPAMDALHAACVRAFEPFRAPISDADLTRRRRAALTPAQEAQLITYGYPYIFNDFRFHMTLTGRIADAAQRPRLVAALARHFAATTGVQTIETLCLFRQENRNAPFNVAHAAPLTGR